MQSLLALSGLVGESMVRDPGWRFMDAGRRIERAIQLARAPAGHRHRARAAPPTDSLLLESVLTAAESIITYRRRYRSQAQLETRARPAAARSGQPPLARPSSSTSLAVDLAAIPALTRPTDCASEQKLVLEASTAVRLADTAAAAPGRGGPSPGADGFLSGPRSRVCRSGRRRRPRPLRPSAAAVALGPQTRAEMTPSGGDLPGDAPHGVSLRGRRCRRAYGQLYLLPRDLPHQTLPGPRR